MKIYLQKAIFANRAPFDKLELDFNDNEIAVLSAVNGKGKTTILSHIVDAFYEMAKLHFQDFHDKADKYYRISSAAYNIDQSIPSLVYLRFKLPDGNIDYVDIRNACTEDQYNESIKIENKIPFNEIRESIDENKNVKKVSSSFNKNQAEKIFYNNLLTYFPSYRYEIPGYLNDPYKIKLDFKKESRFAGNLLNPIEVISGLPQLANWIMDIVLDLRADQQMLSTIFSNLNSILTQTLISKKYGNVRFGIGQRSQGSTRLQIVTDVQVSARIYPSIFNLSSGELSILCIFGELLRQGDTYKSNIQLSSITGIVLIDEVDKHLHIKLQKEILPKLFQLFPNVQFIVSSHSPFLSMGLAEEAKERSKIVDLDSLGMSKDPTTNDLHKEVYGMMVDENERYKELFLSFKTKLSRGAGALIITEGKTDIKHLIKAKEKLAIVGLDDVEFFEIPDNGGSPVLKTLLENVSKIPQSRRVIGIFDRDEKDILKDIEKGGQSYKTYGNNVYAFCIPLPSSRRNYTNISIEFYYTDAEIKKEKNGKCLYFDNEVDPLRNRRTNKNEVRKLATPDTAKELSKKIFCEDIGGEDWIHSKTKFAELVESDSDFIVRFDFNNFNLIFDKIKEIILLIS